MAIRKITVTPTAVSDQDNTSDGFFEIPQGSTAQRPSSPSIGQIRFNTDSNLMEQYNGTGWIVLTSPPTVASISPTTFNGEQGTTITVTGTNFVSGDTTVVFIDNGGNEFTAGSTSFVSSTEVTATTPQDFTVSQEPFDVKVTTSAGSATLEDALDAGGTPAWSTSAGSIGTFESNTAVSETLVATDPDSGATITYAVTSGALPTGVTLNSDGTITGTTPDEDTTTQYNFTVTATDNAGNTADRAFSMTVNLAADANFSPTTLLINADGASDGDQNNTFVDSSTNTHTITRNGNPTQGSFSPFSQDEGKWGNYFDGSGDYINVAASTDFAMGTGDFTIEGWVYFNGFQNVGLFHIDSSHQSSNIGGISVGTSSSALRWRLYYANTGVDTSTDLIINQWQHFAYVRNSGTTKLYVDGTEIFSVSDTTNYTDQYLFIGGYYSTSFLVDGYLSNLRVVKGTAVYTSDFTPPIEPLTAISGTTLLTCQSNRFVDNSSSSHVFTVNGDPEVVPFSPFAPSTAYDPATKGGSGYFDGTSDNLSIANDSSFQFGTGDFTIEAWVYQTAQLSLPQILFKCSADSSWNNGWSLSLSSNGSSPNLYIDGVVVSFFGSSAIALNEWSHVAVSRSGTTLKAFINGAEVDSTTNSANIAPTAALTIGADITSSDYEFQGYISNIRVVKGTAVYTSAFTPPTAPLTDVTNTSLLCNFTNASIVDETGRNVIETVGNAQIDTAVKKYGTGSMYFNTESETDIAKVESSILPQFGGEFTIEFWMYNTNVTGQWHTLISNNYLNSGVGFWRIYKQNNVAALTVYWNASSVKLNSVGTLTNNTWHHIALTRDSSNAVKLFLDGTQVGSTITDSAVIGSEGHINIGAGGTDESGSILPMAGYLDDVRITNGVARYTAGFTPPAQTFGLR